MSKEFVLPTNASFFRTTPIPTIIIVGYITHDGPMSDYVDGGPSRPGTRVQLVIYRRVDELWYPFYYAPVMDAVPFMGAGDSMNMYLKTLYSNATLWLGDIQDKLHRRAILDTCNRCMVLLGQRFMPVGCEDPLESENPNEMDYKTFYTIDEFKVGDVSVWSKRRVNKDGTMTTRWSFVQSLGVVNTELKLSFTEDTKDANTRPMSFREVTDIIPQLRQDILPASCSTF